MSLPRKRRKAEHADTHAALEDRVSALYGHVEALEKRLAALEKRIAALEDQVRSIVSPPPAAAETPAPPDGGKPATARGRAKTAATTESGT